MVEQPLETLRHTIALRAWPSLVRQMGPEADKIIRCLVDSKVKSNRADGNPLLFVPKADFPVYQEALKNSAVEVKPFPGIPSTTKDFEEMDSGLLALEYVSSYMVPGARFNEMYGWD
ncbi:alpha,alpha-trehalase nth1, partial [Perkinsus olseni]